MINLSRSRVIAYLVAIFLVGGVVGALIAVSVTKRVMSAPPRSHDIAVLMRAHLRQRLKLTAEQEQKIDPAVEKASQEIQKIHSETKDKVRMALGTSYEKMAAFLTAEQKTKLEEIQRERSGSSPVERKLRKLHPDRSSDNPQKNPPSSVPPPPASK